MKEQELIERGFCIDINGKIYDENANEYRNEKGEVEYLEVEDNAVYFKVSYSENEEIDG